MSGWLKIVGLGPGSEAMVTPEVTAALEEATDVVGYVPTLTGSRRVLV